MAVEPFDEDLSHQVKFLSLKAESLLLKVCEYRKKAQEVANKSKENLSAVANWYNRHSTPALNDNTEKTFDGDSLNSNDYADYNLVISEDLQQGFCKSAKLFNHIKHVLSHLVKITERNRDFVCYSEGKFLS